MLSSEIVHFAFDLCSQNIIVSQEVTTLDRWETRRGMKMMMEINMVSNETFLSRKYSPLGARQGSPAVTVNHFIWNETRCFY
jgi:hypothetical protein